MKKGTFEGKSFVWVNKEDDPKHVLGWAIQYDARGGGMIRFQYEGEKMPYRNIPIKDFPTLFRQHFGQL